MVDVWLIELRGPKVVGEKEDGMEEGSIED
jgi:hypothetical protein